MRPTSGRTDVGLVETFMAAEGDWIMPITGDRYQTTDENVNAAPQVHGVYALYEGDITTYIGRAAGEGVTIRSRLQDHKAGREGPCTAAATHYRREELSRPMARERELLEEYRNRYGQLPRCNDVMP